MSNDEITPDDVERMARASHERYLAALPDLDPAVPAHRPWEEIREEDRAQNRDQIWSQLDDLRALGLVVERSTAPATAMVRFDAELLEAMARREHDRWTRRKAAQGYRYGPERVDDPPEARRHPDMVDYDDLPEETKDKDRAAVGQFPEILRDAGFVIRPA